MINSTNISIAEFKHYLSLNKKDIELWIQLQNVQTISPFELFKAIIDSPKRNIINWPNIVEWLIKEVPQQHLMTEDGHAWLGICSSLNEHEKTVWWELIIRMFERMHIKEDLFEQFLIEAKKQNISKTILDKCYYLIPKYKYVYAYHLYKMDYPEKLFGLIQNIAFKESDSISEIHKSAKYWNAALNILRRQNGDDIKERYLQKFIEFSNTNNFMVRPPSIEILSYLNFYTDVVSKKALSTYLKYVHNDLSELPSHVIKWLSTKDCPLTKFDLVQIFSNTCSYLTLNNIGTFNEHEKGKYIHELIDFLHDEISIQDRIDIASTINFYTKGHVFLQKMYPAIKQYEVQSFAFFFPELSDIFKNFEKTIELYEKDDLDIIEVLKNCVYSSNFTNTTLPQIDF